MDKIYMLWNYDSDECIYASTDRSLIEELCYDMYMEDCFYDYCHGLRWDYHVTPEEIFEDMDEFYNNYIAVMEVPLIQ